MSNILEKIQNAMMEKAIQEMAREEQQHLKEKFGSEADSMCKEIEKVVNGDVGIMELDNIYKNFCNPNNNINNSKKTKIQCQYCKKMLLESNMAKHHLTCKKK